jgi:DNA-binding transcriptional ArsR family regulator
METTAGAATERRRNEVFTSLANKRRRTVLTVLQRLSAADIEDLATHVVAAETGKSLLEVTRTEAKRVRESLTHRHLPQLAETGLVTEESGTVSVTQHPALADPKIEQMIETDAAGWDAVLESLADRRQRIILTTLPKDGEPVDRDELVTTVAGKIRKYSQKDVSEQQLRIDLHHRHLPKLEAAGLLEYDVDAGTVAYQGHPELDEEWLVAGADDTPRSILSVGHRSPEIWVLDGRANISERGRALCDAAEDELFMMFTVEETVETACLRRINDALERGVDVYVGTRNRELRDLIRIHAPDATIWEPQLDWLNLPPRGDSIGRLIMADREQILIGTIADGPSEEVPRETAITGTGEDNPLVLLLREMLGSRLDHLDSQSEQFLTELPL